MHGSSSRNRKQVLQSKHGPAISWPVSFLPRRRAPNQSPLDPSLRFASDLAHDRYPDFYPH
ncbi:MAG: hypothetical protein CVV09_15925 [Gammaproteobacteria bacterium HGW-Gammaproteobacteria-13]|nr:MAG: hypothetical protein CVV09_15925 [Gammaproteobacteria bacterium HGW-Gammaproteobacteria-13]